jgi:hypothetical protein
VTVNISEYKAARERVIERLGKGLFDSIGWTLIDDGHGPPVLEAPLTAGLHSNCPNKNEERPGEDSGLRRRYQINEVMKKPKEIRNVSLWCRGCQSYVALLMEAVDGGAAAGQKLVR